MLKAHSLNALFLGLALPLTGWSHKSLTLPNCL
jgi:hypothetical protein